MIQNHGHRILKSRFFRSRMIFLVLSCALLLQGYVLLSGSWQYFRKPIMQLSNAICSVPFLGGGIFDKRSAVFVTRCQWCHTCQVTLVILNKHLFQKFRLSYLGISCNFQSTTLQNMPRKKTIRSLCLKVKFSAIFT